MNTKTLKISTFALIAILAFGCKKYSPVAPDDSEPRTPTHTIEQLITDFGSQLGSFSPVRENSGTMGLFSVDTIRSGGDDIIIAGRITSDDANGNMYKYIVIQDLNSDYSLKISVDASGISSYYPLGSIVTIKCNGLAIGKYADMFQLGVVYYNIPNVEDPNASLKTGYEPGRIPFPMFDVRAKVHGMPEINKIKIDTLTIAQIKQASTDRSLHSRLVRIQNVHFTGEGTSSKGATYGQPEIIDSDDLKIFAPTTNGMGYPQSRIIRDDSNNWVAVSTSEYARFANVSLPSNEYVGTVTAIVNWYLDKDGGTGGIQLTLRSLDDLDLKNAAGDKWVPVLPY